MTNYEKIAISSTVIIAAAGLYCGLTTEGINFARSGSLIVIIGVIFGLLDLPSRLSEIDIWVKDQAENIKSSVIESIAPNSENNEHAEIAFDKAAKQAISDINSEARKKRIQLILIEGIILVIGTLIWGFGDLINPVCCAS